MTLSLQAGLDIVIVNWNAGGLLRRCLESVGGSDGADPFLRSVTVVDNASADRSLEQLEETGLPLRILREECNHGYERAANLGAAQGDAPYILFLNPDIALKADSLRLSLERLAALESDGVGILGIALIDEAGNLTRSCARFPSPGQQISESLGLANLLPRLTKPTIMRDWDHARSIHVDHVMGGYALMRRDLFERLGGFDPDYFVYWEDLDLSKRAAGLGAASFYERGIEVTHTGGGTTQRLDEGRRLALALQARRIYARKHLGPLGAPWHRPHHAWGRSKQRHIACCRR